MGRSRRRPQSLFGRRRPEPQCAESALPPTKEQMLTDPVKLRKKRPGWRSAPRRISLCRHNSSRTACRSAPNMHRLKVCATVQREGRVAQSAAADQSARKIAFVNYSAGGCAESPTGISDISGCVCGTGLNIASVIMRAARSRLSSAFLIWGTFFSLVAFFAVCRQ